MLTLEQYAVETSSVVAETAESFHLHAKTVDGTPISIPPSFQIVEPGFRPFRAGKASAEVLQAELNQTLEEAKMSGTEIGIEGPESFRKLLIQLGLGIDCSNFAYRSLSLIHSRLGLGSYEESVFRIAYEIRRLHERKESWSAKDSSGNPRNMSMQETEILHKLHVLDVGWIANVFGKDPEFIMGSRHITGENATKLVHPRNALPGDLVAFRTAVSEVVSHVAVVETVEKSDEEVHIEFWHPWHTRDFQSGLRKDSLTTDGIHNSWSHEGLANPNRYDGHYLCRPNKMDRLTETISSQD
jgi:hypothetical protein